MKFGASVSLVLLCTGLVACSGGDDKPASFTTAGYVTGMVDTPTAIHKGNESCDFYDGQVSAGDPIVIRGAADEILGKGTLEASTLEYAVCSFSFAIDNVKAGQSGYTIKVGTFDPIIASEDEINTEKLGIY